MSHLIRHALVAAVACAVGLTASFGPAGAAEKYPSKAVTVVIPFGGSGASNVIYRALFEYTKKYLGQPLVVVNKPGSGGAVGWMQVQSMKPDGYNLAYGSNSLFLHTHRTGGKLDYKNFDPIVRLNESACAISVNVASGWNSLKDFIQHVKANPGKVRMGNAGAGALFDLCTYQFEKLTGTKIVHVPYQGGPLAATALLGGHIESVMVTTDDLSNVLSTGKIKVLAMAGEKRDEYFPDVPTMREAGVDMVMVLWRGIIAPKGMDKARVAILEKAFEQSTKDRGYIEFMKKNRFTNDFMGTAAFTKAYFEEGELLIGLAKMAIK